MVGEVEESPTCTQTSAHSDKWRYEHVPSRVYFKNMVVASNEKLGQ